MSPIYLIIVILIAGIFSSSAHAFDLDKKTGFCKTGDENYVEFRKLEVKENKTLTDKFLLHTFEETCKIMELKKTFIEKRPEFCELSESKTKCFLRINNEFRKSNPLTLTGNTLMLALGGLLVFKEKEINTKSLTGPKKNIFLIYYAIAMVQISIESVKALLERLTPEKMFKDIKPAEEKKLDKVVINLVKKGNMKNYNVLHDRYPITKTPEFELYVLKLTDEKVASSFLEKAEKKLLPMIDFAKKALEKEMGNKPTKENEATLKKLQTKLSKLEKLYLVLDKKVSVEIAKGKDTE